MISVSAFGASIGRSVVVLLDTTWDASIGISADAVSFFSPFTILTNESKKPPPSSFSVVSPPEFNSGSILG